MASQWNAERSRLPWSGTAHQYTKPDIFLRSTQPVTDIAKVQRLGLRVVDAKQTTCAQLNDEDAGPRGPRIGRHQRHSIERSHSRIDFGRPRSLLCDDNGVGLGWTRTLTTAQAFWAGRALRLERRQRVLC